jgi:hypothetical protein
VDSPPFVSRGNVLILFMVSIPIPSPADQDYNYEVKLRSGFFAGDLFFGI